MIQANELRIGNLIETQYHGIRTVTSIDTFRHDPDFIGIGYYLEEGEWNFEDGSESKGALGRTTNLLNCQPIPLDVEWLDKWYFEVIDDNPKQKPHYQGDVIVKILGYEFTNSMVDGFKCYELCSERGGVTIKYVHQLQNLYYVLCGHELTLQP